MSSAIDLTIKQMRVLHTYMRLKELDPKKYGNEDSELTRLSGQQMDAWYHIQFYLGEFLKEEDNE